MLLLFRSFQVTRWVHDLQSPSRRYAATSCLGSGHIRTCVLRGLILPRRFGIVIWPLSYRAKQSIHSIMRYMASRSAQQTGLWQSFLHFFAHLPEEHSIVSSHLGLGGSSEGFDLDGEDLSDWLHSLSRLQYTDHHRGRPLEWRSLQNTKSFQGEIGSMLMLIAGIGSESEFSLTNLQRIENTIRLEFGH